jgi:hypothetical protein
MKMLRSIAIIFAATALLVAPAVAQSTTQPTAHAKKRAAATPPTTPPGTQPTVPPSPLQDALNPPVAPPIPSPLRAALIEQKCLRALNGACTNPISVEAARLRAEIFPAIRLSYFGTPAGTVGGDYIPVERLFQDNALVFGLPTHSLTYLSATVNPSPPPPLIIVPGGIFRSK